MNDNVQVLSYGPADDEYHHDAMYGPMGNELQPYDVAASPDLGYQLGDWIEVAGKPRRVADWSYLSPDKPNSNTVEIRDRGNVKETSPIRKLSPDEVERLNLPQLAVTPGKAAPPRFTLPLLPEAPGDVTATPPLMPIGDIPTVNDVATAPPSPIPDVTQGSQIRQNIEQYPKLAGPPTEESIQAAGPTQDEVAQSAQEVIQQELDNQANAPTIPSMPDMSLARPQVDANGKLIRNPDGSATMSNGVKVFPDGHMEYTMGGATFAALHPWDKPVKVMPKIVTDQRTGKMYDLTNPQQPKLIPIPGQAGEIAPGATGEAALEGLPEGQKNFIRQLANYEADIRALPARGAQRQQMLERAYAYDPYFDMSQYGVRQAARMSFTKGPDSQNLDRVHTVVGHLNSLLASVEKLDNGDVPLKNYLTNQSALYVGGNKERAATLTRAGEDINAISTDLAALFKGGSGAATDQETEEWRRRFSLNQPADVQKNAISEAVELLKSRINRMQSKYTMAMGKPMDFQVITPHEQEIVNKLEKLGQRDTADTGTPSAAPTGPRYKLDPATGRRYIQLPNGTLIPQ